MCIVMSSDASFDCERILMDLWPKFVKKYVSLTFVDSSNILSGCTKKLSGLVMLTGLPGEAVESISRYARS